MNTGPRLASHSVNAHTVLCIHGEQLTRALERTAHLWVWAVTVHSQTNTLATALEAGCPGAQRLVTLQSVSSCLGDSSSFNKSLPAAPAFEAKRTAPCLKPRFFKLRA